MKKRFSEKKSVKAAFDDRISKEAVFSYGEKKKRRAERG